MVKRYVKEVFDAQTLEYAKHVVLTSNPHDPNKFVRETDSFINTIGKYLTEDSTVLDFGCGMGRISKELVSRFKTNVIGVDISTNMLTFAKLYVRDPDKFTTYTNYNKADSIDTAICTFVLQHVEDPAAEIKNLASVLKTDGIFILVNENERLVPSDITTDNFIVWNNDKFDVFAEVEKYMVCIEKLPYCNTDKFIYVYKNQ